MVLTVIDTVKDAVWIKCVASLSQVQTVLCLFHPLRPSGCFQVSNRLHNLWAGRPMRPWCTLGWCGWWEATPSTTPTTTWFSSKSLTQQHSLSPVKLNQRAEIMLGKIYSQPQNLYSVITQISQDTHMFRWSMIHSLRQYHTSQMKVWTSA